MKIALCISGQPRDIDINFPIHKASILDGNDVDVFIHTWFDPENLSQNSVIPDRVHRVLNPNALKRIYELYQPKRMSHEKPKWWPAVGRKYEFRDKQYDEGHGWVKDVAGGIEEGQKYIFNMTNSMWYSVMMANLFKEQYAVENGIEYDYVVRCRFDFAPHGIINFPVLNLKDDEILCHSTGLPYEMPHDWFAIGRTEPMNAYCGIYHHINEIIKQSIRMDGWWCNELHIKHHMNNNNIKVRHENLLVYGHKGQ